MGDRSVFIFPYQSIEDAFGETSMPFYFLEKNLENFKKTFLKGTHFVPFNFYNGVVNQKFMKFARKKMIGISFSKQEVRMIENKTQIQQRNVALNEIKYLRGMQDFLIDPQNSNRYRIMVKESSGHTAYCFGVPIYNIHTGKLVRPSFEKTKEGYLFQGTSGTVSLCKNRFVFETKEGRAIVFIPEIPTRRHKI
jgi:hypothetical protein